MSERESERREQKRFIVKAKALVNLLEENGKQHFSCITGDMSSKGAYLIAKKTLKPGTAVNLLFKVPIYSNKFSSKILPDKDMITTTMFTTGTVIWSSENEIGVRFDTLCRIAPSD